jgi:hypothetical protein
VLIQDPRKFESINEGEGWIRHNLRRFPAQNTTRRGSNPTRSSDVQMAHQQRAEIFALPFLRSLRSFAAFSGFSLIFAPLRLCVRFFGLSGTCHHKIVAARGSTFY